jgi:hypothetical protein
VKKDQLYQGVKIAGMISFIPFALAAGPLGGYFLGSYLEKRFALGHYVSLITISIGLLTGIIETVRIIKSVYKIENKQ